MECPLCLGPFSDRCGRCGYKPSDDVPELDVREAKNMLESGAVFFDVRTSGERQEASITPSVFIPLYELAARYKELPKGKKIITFCHHGRRSLVAADFLIQKGFSAVSIRGGIEAWSIAIDPSVRQY